MRYGLQQEMYLALQKPMFPIRLGHRWVKLNSNKTSTVDRLLCVWFILTVKNAVYDRLSNSASGSIVGDSYPWCLCYFLFNRTNTSSTVHTPSSAHTLVRSSVFVVAETTGRSSQKIRISIIQNDIHRIKVSQKYILQFWKQKHRRGQPIKYSFSL